MSWQYDAYARRTREDRPDGTATTWAYNDCTTAPGGCTNSNNKMAILVQRLDSADVVVSDSYTYTDRFDRPITTSQLMSGGAYNRIDREYDALGRIDRQTSPCWFTGCIRYWTDYTYDTLGRVTQASRPVSDADPTLQSTTIDYQGLTTVTTDALAKNTTRIETALGQMARSQDHGGYYQDFDFDAFGNVVRVMDSASNTLQSNTYNVRGMLTAQTDMDRGAWVYQPNALGEVTNIRDAKTASPNWTTVMTYDDLGRMTTRQDVAEGVTSTWVWGASAATDNIGRLACVNASTSTSCTAATTAYREHHTYELGTGRLQETKVWIPGDPAPHLIDYTYNSLGALDTLTYPTSTSSYRLKLKYEYQSGRLLRVKDFNAPTTVFWQVNATDARGSVIDESLGNGLQTIRGIDAVTGWLDSIQTGPGGTATIQDLNYLWDKVGNLKQRQDARQSLTEEFFYDNLYRLDFSKLNGVTNLDMTYDPTGMGNITSKSDVGAYTYHATKKHAVVTAGSNTYAYDANGNQTTRNGQTTTWYSYNLPNTINGGTGFSSQFSYTPDLGRWKQVANYGGTTETTIYIGGLIEKATLGTVTSWKHYIAGGTGPAVVYTRKSSGTPAIETHYLTRDHLGSIDSVTNASGGVEVRLSYTAFGQRRKEAGWSGNPTSADWAEITDTTRRGFTAHESLDNLSLVHMNGRVDDPVAGRFTAADPFVVPVSQTQRFNRYSYVANRTLSLSDPTGFKPRYLPVDGGGLIEITGYPDTGGAPGGPAGGGSFYGGGSSGSAGRAGDREGDDSGYQEPVAGEDGMPEVTVIAQIPQTPGTGTSSSTVSVSAIKDWLCKEGGSDSRAQRVVDAADNASGAAEAGKPLVEAGIAAAVISKADYSRSTSFLGNEISSGLSKLGEFGKITGALGIFLELSSGDTQGALYSGVDYLVYSKLAAAGAEASPETLGASAALAAALGLLYYGSGGSEGLVQSALGCR